MTPTGVRYCGELRFQFLDGLSLHGYVFTATDCDGDPRETEEATPLWTPIDAIPYDEMWADDRLWVPLMLAGTRFEGRFLFDGDRMLGHEIDAASGEDARSGSRDLACTAWLEVVQFTRARGRTCSASTTRPSRSGSRRRCRSSR